MKAPEFPLKLQIEVTNHCNYACIMCPRHKSVRPLGYMDERLFAKIIDESSRYKPMIWCHYIGEPLMHKGIFRMIGHAKSAGLKVGFSTNASLLDEDKAVALLDLGVDRVECSLDAASPETYKLIRRKGNLDVIEENIIRLAKMKYERALSLPVISVQFVVHKENQAELNKFVAKWNGILKGGDFVKGSDFITWGGELAYQGISEVSTAGSRKPCKKLWESLVILWDGTVIPCANDINARMPVGDASKSSIKEIWHGNKLEAMRKAHLDCRLDGYGPCLGCNEWVLESDKDKYRNLTNV